MLDVALAADSTSQRKIHGIVLDQLLAWELSRTSNGEREREIDNTMLKTSDNMSDLLNYGENLMKTWCL